MLQLLNQDRFLGQRICILDKSRGEVIGKKSRSNFCPGQNEHFSFMEAEASQTFSFRSCSQSIECRKLGYEEEIHLRHQEGSFRRDQAFARKRAQVDQAVDG